MKEELVIRINTLESLAVASEIERESIGMYTNIDSDEAEEYITNTFAYAIPRCIKQNECSELEENVELSNEIKAMIEQNSRATPFQIRVQDENGYMKNATNSRSEVMTLQDKIEPYLKKKTYESGEKYAYLDMVVELNSKVGV